MKLTFEIIPGTQDIVKSEIEKILSLKAISVDESHLETISNLNTKELRELKTPLRVTIDEKKTINLFRRDWKIASSPAGTNPSLAYILCWIAGIKEKDVIFDPFCGSGTIVISSAKYFNLKKAIGSDISSTAIQNAIKNSQAAKVDKKKIIFFESNIRDINFKGKSIDKVITNMPFGIRAANHEKNIKSYQNFEKICFKNLRNSGTIVALTLEKKLFKEIMSKNFKIIKTYDIDQNGLYSSIFVLKRKNS